MATVDISEIIRKKQQLWLLKASFNCVFFVCSESKTSSSCQRLDWRPSGQLSLFSWCPGTGWGILKPQRTTESYGSKELPTSWFCRQYISAFFGDQIWDMYPLHVGVFLQNLGALRIIIGFWLKWCLRFPDFEIHRQFDVMWVPTNWRREFRIYGGCFFRKTNTKKTAPTESTKNLQQRRKLGGGFKYFLFSSLPAKWSNLTDIFEMGWNHQLENIRARKKKHIRVVPGFFFLLGWWSFYFPTSTCRIERHAYVKHIYKYIVKGTFFSNESEGVVFWIARDSFELKDGLGKIAGRNTLRPVVLLATLVNSINVSIAR